MKHDEMIAVIEAHKNGKTIQYFTKFCTDAVWTDCWGNPLWNFGQYDYRVKIESLGKSALNVDIFPGDKLVWVNGFVRCPELILGKIYVCRPGKYSESIRLEGFQDDWYYYTNTFRHATQADINALTASFEEVSEYIKKNYPLESNPYLCRLLKLSNPNVDD